VNATASRAADVDHSRAATVRALLDELEVREGDASDGRYDALTALVTDALLAADEAALLEAQDGLQRLHAAQLEREAPDERQLEQRGRVLAALGVVTWTLRRLTPSELLARLEPGGHNLRFLERIDSRPGLSNGELARALDADETEVSRVGRRLVQAGLASKHRVGRRNLWRITPRGRQALQAHAPAREAAEHAAPA
jgi:DNA-binding MarR family transcriptional regulator